MACPGGCIGGGGQPYPPEGVKVLDPNCWRKRAARSTSIDDSGKKLRKSHENPAIDDLYERRSWAARAERPTNCCTRTTQPAAERHPMSTACVTDNWHEVEAPLSAVLGPKDRAASSSSAGTPEPRSH
jgi:hypothetical protein